MKQNTSLVRIISCASWSRSILSTKECFTKLKCHSDEGQDIFHTLKISKNVKKKKKDFKNVQVAFTVGPPLLQYWGFWGSFSSKRQLRGLGASWG